MDRTSGQEEPAPALPPSLRFLKWLVILLTLSMIGGVITVVALLVTRMPAAMAPRLPTLPDSIALPAGTTPQAVTFGPGWVAVVAGAPDGQRILVYGTDGTLRGETLLAPE
ncbi:MAG TPA: DUF6476 family protein [Paracoccaceae bacterium]|nr:DUF6476 family protein [Paracoccaceae bacterium]